MKWVRLNLIKTNDEFRYRILFFYCNTRSLHSCPSRKIHNSQFFIARIDIEMFVCVTIEPYANEFSVNTDRATQKIGIESK